MAIISESIISGNKQGQYELSALMMPLFYSPHFSCSSTKDAETSYYHWMHTCKKGSIEKTGQGCCKGHSFMDLFLRAKTSSKQLEGVVHDGYIVFYIFDFSEVDDT